MSQYAIERKRESVCKKAVEAFWDTVKAEYPEIPDPKLNQLLEHNFPLLCYDAIDRWIKVNT